MKMSREEFTTILNGQDELLRQWAIDVRDAYHSLRWHADPNLREVWLLNFEKTVLNLKEGHTVKQKIALGKARDFIAHGKQLQISQSSFGRYAVTYSSFSIFLDIPRLELEEYVKVDPKKQIQEPFTPQGKVEGKFAFVKPVLFSRPNSLRYARNALPGDPASRLMLLVDTDRGDGNGKLRVLQAKGEYTVKAMNRLVDMFEGIEYDESIKLGRRLPSKKDRKAAAEKKAS